MELPTQAWGNCVVNGVATLKCIPVVINNVATFLIMFSAVVAVFLIIYAGVKFINSHGDPQAVESAKKTMTYAIFGMIFVILCFLILKFLSEATGVQEIYRPEFPTS